MYITIHGSENVKSVQFFFSSSSAKLHVHTSGCTARFKLVHRHYLILDYTNLP